MNSDSQQLVDEPDLERRIVRLSWKVSAGATLQFCISTSQLVLALVFLADRGSYVRHLTASCVGMTAASFGMYSGFFRKEFPARVAFVFTMFLMTMLATFWFRSIDNENVASNMCTPLVGDKTNGHASDQCQERLRQQQAKLVVTIIGFFLSLANVSNYLDLNDVLNDKSVLDKIDDRIVHHLAQDPRLPEKVMSSYFLKRGLSPSKPRSEGDLSPGKGEESKKDTIDTETREEETHALETETHGVVSGPPSPMFVAEGAS
eukprot:PhF_6_TR28340/c0_g2_i2/m.42015